MLAFRVLPFQNMIHLWGIRYALFDIKINLQLSRVNGKTAQCSTEGKEVLWRRTRRDRKKS